MKNQYFGDVNDYRKYVSVFGRIRFRRRYHNGPDGHGRCPLDAALDLPARCYSDLLRDWLEYALANDAYDHRIPLVIRILGSTSPSTSWNAWPARMRKT